MDVQGHEGSRWVGWLALASGAVGAVIFAAMIRVVGRLDPGVGAIQLTFTEPAFRRILDAWGPDGRRRFAAHFAYDYPFMICFGLFGWALGAWLSRRLQGRAWLASLLPWLLPAAAVGDAIEDLLQQALAGADPGSWPAGAYLIAGLAATVKWGLVAVFAILIPWAAWLVARGGTSTPSATAGEAGR